MPRRNFGLSPRVSPFAQTRASANAGALFFTWKACFQGFHNRFGKRDRLSRQGIAVRIVAEYMGRVLFHYAQTYAAPSKMSPPVWGELRIESEVSK